MACRPPAPREGRQSNGLRSEEPKDCPWCPIAKLFEPSGPQEKRASPYATPYLEYIRAGNSRFRPEVRGLNRLQDMRAIHQSNKFCALSRFAVFEPSTPRFAELLRRLFDCIGYTQTDWRPSWSSDRISNPGFGPFSGPLPAHDIQHLLAFQAFGPCAKHR